MREVTEDSGDSSWLIFGLHISTIQPLLNIQTQAAIEDELDYGSNEYSNGDLNETFTITEAEAVCEHQYEAEVVVVTVSDRFLHMQSMGLMVTKGVHHVGCLPF